MASNSLFIGLILAALTLNLAYGAVNEECLPELDLDEWWGPGNASYAQDTSIRKFKIRFDDAMIKDLKYRLKNHRHFTPSLRGIAFQYGCNSHALNFWIKYVAEQYPFKKREQFLNKYPHFTTVIQGLTIHFMRVKSKNIRNRKVVPLLLLHGWPGSIREFYEAIPHLHAVAEAKDLALDIIVPSLPGFGFSDGATRPGMGTQKAAVVCRNLMHRVGYKEYYIQGGDFGATIASSMATFFRNEVKGYHSNFPLVNTLEAIMLYLMGSLTPSAIIKPELQSRVYPLTTTISNLLDGSGYMHIQATRPDTVGFGLSDSPSALIAYMVDKISNFLRAQFITRPDGGLTELLTAEQIIDNYMLYWTPNSMTTAMRMYSEFFTKKYLTSNVEAISSPVPVWVIQAPNELLYVPTTIIKKKFPNLLHETLPSVGGHFYAWERPKDYAVDVINALLAFRKWHENNNNMCAMSSRNEKY